MRYYIVDAFTQVPFSGNTAGVVSLGEAADFPSQELMLRVADELRYSETAFVRQDSDREFTVRYFTPRFEVPLCGHATIATFGMLRHEGVVHSGDVCINHTLAGDLQVRIDDKQVMMQMAEAQVIPSEINAQRLYRIMCGDDAQPCLMLPLEVVSTGLPDIIMPVGSIEVLNALQPDMDALAQVSGEMEVTGIHAFAIADDGFTAHVRNFAPLYGIPEESATGTANAALTHYLLRHALVTVGETCRYVQGEAMGRPSLVSCSFEPDGSIYVGGNCCVVARGLLMVDETTQTNTHHNNA